VKCRFCQAVLSLQLVDLGSAPPSNAYLTEDQLAEPERHYPLRVLVCETCWLAQTEDFADRAELFDASYAYFSGFSATWLAHVERYAADMVKRFGLGPGSHVVEVATNDGSLLQCFQARGIECTGVEPTASTAAAARGKGIRVLEEFFGARVGRDLARRWPADLIAANNVLAHVPDINDFVAGFPELLAPDGVATFEFPHLMRLIDEAQFDTIYHEHFSYLSFTTVVRIFEANGLDVFDVDEIPVHGGSLRVFAQRSDTGTRERNPAVDVLRSREKAAGMTQASYYATFQARAERARDRIRAFLEGARSRREQVVAFGAAAKGSTLLNFAAIGPELIEFVVDGNPAKQGRYLPGSHIPIVTEDRLRQERPSYVLILPWNLRSEIAAQLRYIAGWGGRFVTAIPGLEVWT
jgi:SAM-dependent methyltransferase